MKLLMLMADGFEDVEAIATLDVLRRGGIDVTLLSLMQTTNVLTKTGHAFATDIAIKDFKMELASSYEGLIIPGGPASFRLMPKMPVVTEFIHYFSQKGKLVATICAAPHLVGKLGYFKERNYTVHPGFEDAIIGGHYVRDLGVIVSDNFITAKSMFYSIPFALAIYAYFYGETQRNLLEKSLMGEK